MTTGSPTTTARHSTVDSPLGPLTLVRDDAGYTGLYFAHHWPRPDRSGFGARIGPADSDVSDAISQLAHYLAGTRRAFDLPLAADGDAVQQRLRAQLRAIPYGRTIGYGELAAALGGELTARDVGQLVGRNPLSILVPCHRVVGATGALTGYAGGIERKRYLLELEGALPPALVGLETMQP